jgi:hypothetical protein
MHDSVGREVEGAVKESSGHRCDAVATPAINGGRELKIEQPQSV